MTLYPDGYGTAEVTLERMVAKHGGKAHPEFWRRLTAWLISEGGRMGVGGGWRQTQPIKPGFAPPGMSFHETQVFASGFAGYAAVDLVHRQPGQVHRSPTWAETESAKEFGLHTFVSGEPWHIQCIEMRGYQTWVNAGRPDPQPIALPGDKPTPPPPTTPKDIDMIAIKYERGGPEWTGLMYTGTQLAHVTTSNAWTIPIIAGVPVITVDDVQLDDLIASSQTTTDAPPEFSPARKAEWNANRG